MFYTEYTPKWKNNDTTTTQILSKKRINQIAQTDSVTSSSHQRLLEKLLGVESSENTPLLLCPNCYTKLHRLYTTQNCSSCGTMLKPGIKLCRHSPDFVKVYTGHHWK